MKNSRTRVIVFILLASAAACSSPTGHTILPGETTEVSRSGGSPGSGTGGTGTAFVGSGGVAGGMTGQADAGLGSGGAVGGTVGRADAGLGSGGAAGGTTGGINVGGSTGGGLATVKPPCLKDPNQVAMLGDSYVAGPSYIGKAIVAAAVADGTLASDQSYQDLAVPGTTVNSGQIPGQLDSALAKYPKLKTYISDGCGNDIIQSIVCLAPGSDQSSFCTGIIDKCIAAFRAMAEKAKAAGVTDAILFQYPDNVPIGGADILRYGVAEGKKVSAEMTTADFRVYLVDTAPLMKDHPTWYVDGMIHVDANGAKLIASAIYGLMKDHCIAQPEGRGCCQAW